MTRMRTRVRASSSLRAPTVHTEASDQEDSVTTVTAHRTSLDASLDSARLLGFASTRSSPRWSSLRLGARLADVFRSPQSLSQTSSARASCENRAKHSGLTSTCTTLEDHARQATRPTGSDDRAPHRQGWCTRTVNITRIILRISDCRQRSELRRAEYQIKDPHYEFIAA